MGSDARTRGKCRHLGDDKTRTVGYFALLTGNSTQNGGFYLSAQMPDDLARIIDEIL